MPELAGVWQRQRSLAGTGGWQLSSAPQPVVSPAGLAMARYAARREEQLVLVWPVAGRKDAIAAEAIHGAGVHVLAVLLPSFDAVLSADIAVADWDDGAAGLVAALNDRWGVARIDAGAQAVDALLKELDSRGFIPEQEVAEALGYCALDDLAGRLGRLDPARGLFMPGTGLCSAAFAEAMRRGLRRKPRRRPAA
jgi:hypothetical protein